MARKLVTFGPQVKLISPQFVRPFVKGNKNDFVDAEAICEAASCPSTRFVTPKTESQQTLSALHRVLESLIRDRTAPHRTHRVGAGNAPHRIQGGRLRQASLAQPSTLV